MEKREKFSNKLILILFIVFISWSVLQFLAPLSLSEGSVDDLTGLVGLADNEDAIENMPFPANLVYSCGDRLCHQKSERSFFINGNQMPFCSRCTAIWLGLAIGLSFMTFYKINLNEKFIFIIFIGITPIAIDGLGQLFNLWESTAVIRVITGLLVGFVCGVSIGIIIDELRGLRKKEVENK